MPECAFVIPTKDRPIFLMSVLESVRMAVGPRDQVIVMDSSAEDTTRTIALQSGVVTNYIRCPELKQVPATNRGIEIATKEFVRVFSDDDIVVAEGHRKALEVFAANPDIDMLVTGGVKFWTNGEHGWAICLPDNAGYGLTIDSIFHYGSFGGGQIVRRNVFSRMGYFREISICDQEFAMRVVTAGLKVRFVRTLSYYHPTYEHSGMRKNRVQVDMEFAQLLSTFKPMDPVMRHTIYPPVWDQAIV